MNFFNKTSLTFFGSFSAVYVPFYVLFAIPKERELKEKENELKIKQKMFEAQSLYVLYSMLQSQNDNVDEINFSGYLQPENSESNE